MPIINLPKDNLQIDDKLLLNNEIINFLFWQVIWIQFCRSPNAIIQTMEVGIFGRITRNVDFNNRTKHKRKKSYRFGDSNVLGNRIGKESRMTLAVTDIGLAKQVANKLDVSMSMEV